MTLNLNRLFIISVSLIFLSFIIPKSPWGFFAHKRINRLAIFTLPPEMIPFYKYHLEYVTEHAVDPDKRRYLARLEAYRHYIDVDHWDVYPFDKMPRKWSDALAKYTEVYVITDTNDTLQLFGETVSVRVEQDWIVKSPDIYSLTNQDSLMLSYYDYKGFIINSILSQYYKENWLLEVDSILPLFDSIPVNQNLKGAYAKDKLTPYGILPWNLEQVQRRLQKAFETKDLNRILRHSADLGHYIGDAHVPLHTTENYNGQLTNQVGIHAFWESRLPELFADETYDYFVGKADYIDNPNAYYWQIVLDSHVLLDSVLAIEKELKNTLSDDQLYCFENKGQAMIRTECFEFADIYHQRLDGMVESRMRAAIKAVGDAWYTAWVDAGQPNLNEFLVDYEPTIVEQKERKTLENQLKTGKALGRKHE